MFNSCESMESPLFPLEEIQWMRMALREAETAYDEDEVPVGCVIVHESKVIGRAHNQTERLKDPTAHAEMLAITQAASYLERERLLGCTLYVTLEPCFMCAGACVLARLDKIFFAAKDPKFGACGSIWSLPQEGRLNHNCPCIGGILAEESAQLLKSFFRGRR